MKEVRDYPYIREGLDSIEDWDTSDFDFSVPPSDFQDGWPMLDLENQFVPPSYNEKYGLSRTVSGGHRPLDSTHRRQIRDKGQFEVASEDFPGQTYRWEINDFFQKGRQRIMETMRDNLAGATDQFIEGIPAFMWRNCAVSVRASGKSLAGGMWRVLLLPIGRRRRGRQQVHSARDLARLRLSLFLDTVLNGEEDIDIQDLLFDDELKTFRARRPAYQTQMDALVAEQKHRRPQRIADLMEDSGDATQVLQMLADEEAQKQQRVALTFIDQNLSEECQVRKFEDVLAFMAAVGVAKTQRNLERDQALSAVKSQLEQHSILNRCVAWRNRKITARMLEWDAAHLFDQYLEDAVEHDELTDGTSYIIYKRMQKLLNDDEYARKASMSEQVPKKIYKWKFRIWRPSHWRRSQGTDGRYRCDKYRRVTTSSGFFGWRLVNLFMRVITYVNNASFNCFVNVLYGPVGLRSLFGLDDFQPDRKADSATGALIPCGLKFTTWFGRIRALWHNIAECRERFRDSDDHGFFGKTFTNPFNWFWNYVAKGVVGTAFCFVTHPLLALIVTPLSLILGVTSVLWGPAVALFNYFFNLAIYDIDGIDGLFPVANAILWKMGVQGGVAFGASIVGIAAHAARGILKYAWSLVRALTRYLYDTAVFYVVIKRFGRIPHSDTFTARQIAGPGLGMKYYYKIDDQVVALLYMLFLENQEIEAWTCRTSRQICQPLNEYKDFMRAFEKYGLKLDTSHPRFRAFESTKRQLKQSMSDKVRQHWEETESPRSLLGNLHIKPIRLSSDDLSVVTSCIGEICESFYLDRILDYMDDEQIADLWQQRSLAEGDWTGLGMYHLRQIFGDSICVPIEEVDAAGFCLEVKHIDGGRYLSALWAGDLGDDLDEVSVRRPTVRLPRYDILPASSIVVVSPFGNVEDDVVMPRKVWDELLKEISEAMSE